MIPASVALSTKRFVSFSVAVCAGPMLCWFKGFVEETGLPITSVATHWKSPLPNLPNNSATLSGNINELHN